MTPVIANAMDLRSEIDRLMESGSIEPAANGLRELWRHETTQATAAFVCSRFEKLCEKLPLVAHRLAILRSFTVEPVIPLLRAAAFCCGVNLTVQVGDFNTFVQDILDPVSSLYRFSADSVILAVRTPDIAPELWDQYADKTMEELRITCERLRTGYEQWIAAFRSHSQAALIVHNLEQPIRPMSGALDASSEPSQSEAIRQVNRELRRSASEHRGVYLLDYDGLVARYGRLRWLDQRKYLMARLPISSENLIHLSREWLRFLVPLSGRVAKVLVTDLDNTLWGGVIGEDGIAGIQLGPDYPGAAYLALQRAMIDISKRGILLAICSKNNPDDAMEVLQKHPSMLLRPKDFASMRISWNDKAQGLSEIASELNIGIDSVAFLDDNPFEREQVRATIPEVIVIDLPDHPLEYATTLRDCPAFERLTVSVEDLQRTTMYAEQQLRTQAQQNFRSKEDFFRFLAQEVEIAPVTPQTLTRVAQLTQKTNQFNLTTRRYSEQEIMNMASQPGWQVLSIRVCDRFGDHGLVGVVIAHDHGGTCEIDTFLLSCRVIGRTVETAFLSHVAERALARQCVRLCGRFIPTKKNAPAREFYPQHGFQLAADNNGEGSLWVLNLKERRIFGPEWIKLSVSTGESI